MHSETPQLQPIVPAYHLRILTGKWNPLMLANYANRAGIVLEGVKRFEEHYRELKRR